MGPGIALEWNYERLLQAIVKDPDNDGLRLRFAQELDKDPRTRAQAEFIRIQLRMADLSQALDTPDGFGLLRHARNLWQEHGAHWVHPLWRKLELPVPQYGHYHRGLLELLDAPGFRIVKAGEEIFRWAPIRHVNVRSLGEHTLSEVCHCLRGSNLRSLSIECLNLTGPQVKDVDWAELSTLRWLSIAGNGELTREDVSGLVRDWRVALPRLKFVNFDGIEADPRERLLYDQDVATGSILEQWAAGLQGDTPVAWLRPQVTGGRAALVDRFICSEPILHGPQ